MKFYLRSQSKNPQRLVAEADSARDQRDWPAAVQLYRAALDLQPDEAPIWVQYGHALKETGDLTGAENAYRKALEIAPSVDDTHLQLGHVNKLLGKLVEASAAYERALMLRPENADARRELDALREIGVSPGQADSAGMPALSDEPRTVFDCSDLVQYLRDNRLPTGIQRVQTNIVSSYMSLGDLSHRAAIVFFDADEATWHEIPLTDFHRLVNSAQNIDGVGTQAWEAIRHQICGAAAPTFRFRTGDVLVNLGTSWWIPDYFMHIRNLKRDFGIRYLPFIHDCIPLIVPEYCSKSLVQEFRYWIGAVFAHADGYLCNSDSTARDLAAIADRSGFDIPKPTVIRLDGDVRSYGQLAHSNANVTRAVDELLLRERVSPAAPFVLMVGTLEARKNHLAALRVWDLLITEHGEDRTPFLLCVGKEGWRFEVTKEYFEARRQLAKRVRFVSNVSDSALAELYRRSLFTLYPSHYEGWGLPVTESLCHGKVPVVADNSSLTEAGGEFAVYFESGANRQLSETVTKLIEDEAYRTGLESAIAVGFKARTWVQIAKDIAGETRQLVAKTDSAPFTCPQTLVSGKIHILAKPSHIEPQTNRVSAEFARVGEGWHHCEDWGTWTRRREALLSFLLSPSMLSSALLYVTLRGHPVTRVNVRISCPETGQAMSFEVPAGVDHRVTMRLGKLATSDQPVQIMFETDSIHGLSTAAKEDRRKAGIGVCWLAVIEDDIDSRLNILEALQFDQGQPAD